MAILLLLIIFYFLDRRYIGLFPSVTKPIREYQRARKIEQELRLNPHHTANRLELARIWMNKRKYGTAIPYLQEVYAKVEDSAEVLYELGLCYLKTGKVIEGERMILEALKDNPKLKYGEPYLELGEEFSKKEIGKALRYLEQIRDIHSSSSETYYRLGQLYLRLGRNQEARSSFNEALEIYRSLPKYIRRKQRKWALLSRLKSWSA
ncbi:tetratricopeptide repeat protein [Ammoniphilus sp. 3BR4]